MRISDRIERPECDPETARDYAAMAEDGPNVSGEQALPDLGWA